MEKKLDDMGNIQGFDMDNLINEIVDVESTDGKEFNKSPEEKAETKEVEEKVEDSSDVEGNVDEIEDIVDELVDDKDEATNDNSDTEEEKEETESSEEKNEANSEIHSVTIDGEDHEVTLEELKKGYGLQSS